MLGGCTNFIEAPNYTQEALLLPTMVYVEPMSNVAT